MSATEFINIINDNTLLQSTNGVIVTSVETSDGGCINIVTSSHNSSLTFIDLLQRLAYEINK